MSRIYVMSSIFDIWYFKNIKLKMTEFAIKKYGKC